MTPHRGPELARALGHGEGRAGGIHVTVLRRVQRGDHPSRVHLDIETDDIEAEVARLEGLGAKRVEQVSSWWIMEAPSGHRFCVIPASRAGFEARANRWD